MFGLARLFTLAGNLGWQLNPRSTQRWLREKRRPIVLRPETLEDRVVPTLLGQQLFPTDYPWNQNISNAPVAANSAAVIANIGATVGIHPDWGEASPANGNSPLYGIPVNIVHGNSVPKVTVVIDDYADESDIIQVPIPPNVVLEGDYQNGPNPFGPGYGPNRRGDSHMLIWDQDNNIAYELFAVARPTDPVTSTGGPTGGVWHAAQQSVWNMNTNSFRQLGHTSADAAGLSILAGLARPDEGLPVAQGGQGAINHAIRVTLPSSLINPQYIYPASHMVSGSIASNKLPFGARLRLMNTPSLNAVISTLGPQAQIVAYAMQQYGLVVADIGSAMYITGSSASVNANNVIDRVWNMDDILGLSALKASHFEVVNLTPVVTSLSASSGAAGSTLTITGKNFSGSAGRLSVLFGTTPASSVTLVSDSQINVIVPAGSGTVNVTVKSGINATDPTNPSRNVTHPVFGYGISATSPADLFTFTTQPISGSLSTVSFSTPTVVAGSNAVVTLVVKNTAGNPVAGLSNSAFTLSLTGGVSAGTFGTVSATATAGTYTASFTGTTAGSASSLNAVINGITLTSHPSITVTLGPVSSSASTVTVASPTVVPGGTDLITITVKDAAGNAIAGLANSAFALSLGSGTSAGTFGPVSATATPGTYAATFTATTAGTPRAIVVAVNGITLNNQPTIAVGSSSTFSDNFSTAGPGQQLTNSWTNQIGSFLVNTGQGTAIGNAPLSLATANGFSSVDEAVSAVVTVAPGQVAGLVARYSGLPDQNMQYAFLIGNQGSYTAAIYRAYQGTWTQIFTQTYSGSVTNATMAFHVVGSSLRLFLNGTLVAYGNDTVLTTPGTVGMRNIGAAVMKNFSAGPLSLQNAPSATTFTDNFSTPGANQQLSNYWLNQSGNFQVSGATAVGAAAVDLATVNGINSANESVSAMVTVAPGQVAGLVARYSGVGDQNMYYAFVVGYAGSYTASIFRNVNGAWAQLFTQAYAGAITDAALEFQVVGSSQRLFLNGNLIGSANDTALTTPGSVGMRNIGGALMKNFAASPLTPINASLPYSDSFSSPNGQLSAAWNHQVGHTQITSGAARSSGSYSLATLNGVSASNVTVHADVTLSGVGQVAGLVARYSGSGDQNMYYAAIAQTGIGSYLALLYVHANGVWTLRASQAVSLGSGALRLAISGTSLSVSYRGSTLFTVTDSSLTAGTVGVRLTAGATMDNFTAS